MRQIKGAPLLFDVLCFLLLRLAGRLGVHVYATLSVGAESAVVAACRSFKYHFKLRWAHSKSRFLANSSFDHPFFGKF